MRGTLPAARKQQRYVAARTRFVGFARRGPIFVSEPCAFRTFRVQNFHWKSLRLNLAREFLVLDSGADWKLD